MDSESQRIYQQIEQAADLHQPAVYKQLLSFYQALELEPDPAEGKFVPMTTVLRTFAGPSETKIFAVGLIPPAAAVTGRILDRSASIKAQTSVFDNDSALLSSAEEVTLIEAEEVQSNAVNTPQFPPSVPNHPAYLAPTKRTAEKSAALVSGLHPSIQMLANKLIALAAQQGISLVICQGHRSIEYQNELYAQGRTAPGKIVTGTKGGESWHNFGLAFDVAMVSPGPKPAPGQPAWPKGKDAWSVVGGLGQSIGLVWGGTFSKIADYGHFEYHPGISKAQARAGTRPLVPNEPLPIVDTALPAPKWNTEGCVCANKAAQTFVEIADTDLNTTGLGLAYSTAQQSMVGLMQDALDRMARTPPLRMLINPQSFSVSSEKLIASGSWGRSGMISEHWGEQQDKIEGSGRIAAFYSREVDGSGPGLTRTARQFSTSYQNLLSLFLLYKNNGGIWLADPTLPATVKGNNLALVGSVYLYFDNILYIGSFDSLSLTESDDAPFTLEFSFSFTVRATYLMERIEDPTRTYRPVASGAPGTAALPATSTSVPPLQAGSNLQPSPEVPPPPGVNIDQVKEDRSARSRSDAAFAALDDAIAKLPPGVTHMTTRTRTITTGNRSTTTSSTTTYRPGQ